MYGCKKCEFDVCGSCFGSNGNSPSAGMKRARKLKDMLSQTFPKSAPHSCSTSSSLIPPAAKSMTLSSRPSRQRPPQVCEELDLKSLVRSSRAASSTPSSKSATPDRRVRERHMRGGLASHPTESSPRDSALIEVRHREALAKVRADTKKREGLIPHPVVAITRKKETRPESLRNLVKGGAALAEKIPGMSPVRKRGGDLGALTSFESEWERRARIRDADPEAMRRLAQERIQNAARESAEKSQKLIEEALAAKKKSSAEKAAAAQEKEQRRAEIYARNAVLREMFRRRLKKAQDENRDLAEKIALVKQQRKEARTKDKALAQASANDEAERKSKALKVTPRPNGSLPKLSPRRLSPE
eukprot:CAMPEP_0172595588 /NCGR_PEP_ID=MMETSP1068-20121228/15189_1 /TAXON_ID=35684 /ORGANISM="Pseudopedinella elastica, Strain CCMP716" /LENGTH=357 /DNA_ID=CAMNT_0013394197 /DNA_START=106 /DNA_END=1179 /DNA_ORIENTATION=+